MTKVEMPLIRRQQLIAATIATIDELGLAETTIARIAKRAGMSSGIISHYFGGKSGLLEATMRQLLTELGDAVAYYRKQRPDDSVRAHIRAIIDGNFDDSQTSRASMRVWLAFWTSSMHEPELERLQRVNERRLLANLSFYFRQVMPKEQALLAAQSMAAMIDGLWLRGSLNAGRFDDQQARTLAYHHLEQQLAHFSQGT